MTAGSEVDEERWWAKGFARKRWSEMKSGVAVSMQLPGLLLLGPALEYAR